MEKPFEIGLVMAGAVSAGAYTAGVIDFLIEALDEWQRLKDANDPSAPRHAVELKVIAGTSAGGMTAAMVAGALAVEHHPVRDPERAPPQNKLFDSWVERIDIAPLLGARDLQGNDGPLRSLLDSSVLDAIAGDALAFGGGTRRAFVSPQLHLVTTASNLRGVPYNVPFPGEAYRGGHEMYAHADYMHFVVSDTGCECPDALWLDWAKQQTANWKTLEVAALATGAFPVGLAPRTLAFSRTHYAQRRWEIPEAGEAADGGCRYTHHMRAIPPSWPADLGGDAYAAVCVDGGVMNNEPFDIARRIMLNGECSTPREADKTTRALVMIDPFPGADLDVSKYEAKEDLLSVFFKMFNAMKNQSRFKPDELLLAQNPDVFSRFLVAPSRKLEDGSVAPFPIACGALGGFSGFLSRDFRVHDYQLGRRNCWAFLKRHFNLAETHPLFEASWDDAQRPAHRIEDGGKNFLPLIPLLGSAAEQPAQPVWPRYTDRRLAALRDRIGRRYDAVSERLAAQFTQGRWFARQGLKFFLWRKRKDLLDKAEEKVLGALRAFGLYYGE
ncbi:patatin-like phospholipase family protein [Thiobacillus sp.]|uniref:patatin-like phospholipase family protein n=1 Tax=Thiobacillus sp. TaxID=924 RepID=UPI00286E8170|nr:patatin-like phospholipase family protein [Thiobacillus sp.]